MTEFGALLGALAAGGVDFIVVGGAAATAHGAARLTQDLDVVYRRDKDNIHRLIVALKPFAPYLRGAPPGLPFFWDEQTFRRGINVTLATTLGALDLLGEITGGGDYDALNPFCIRLDLFGVPCLCLGLERLIQVKRAAGWPKDFEAIAELEAVLEEMERNGK